MSATVTLIIMIAIGGLIGYITNYFAIKMLFRPINPINLGLFTLQGVFPKRKDEMAISLAKTIEDELLTDEAIFNQLLGSENKQILKELIISEIAQKIQEKIPPMVKMLLGQDFDSLIANFINNDADDILDSIVSKWKEDGGKTLDIYSLVKNKIDELDFIEFEKIIFGLINKELRFVEIIGLFLGSIIGVIQYLITTFL